MTPQPRFQFRTVTLNPAPDRCMVRLETALGEQLFGIAERERVPKIPTDCAENEFGCRLPPLEDCRSGGLLHGLFRLPATPRQSCNTSVWRDGERSRRPWFGRRLPPYCTSSGGAGRFQRNWQRRRFRGYAERPSECGGRNTCCTRPGGAQPGSGGRKRTTLNTWP